MGETVLRQLASERKKMMAQPTTLLGIDWGSSNRRAYILSEQGDLLRQHEDDAGILNVKEGFEASLTALLEALDLGGADIILSGMVGSRNGWKEAPYLSVDHPLSQLGDALMTIDTRIPGTRVRVVPGYRYVDPHGLPDVMRGEEAQVLGALELSAADGWFLLPGTHSKWVRVDQGRIAEFMTFMTGELYALMSQHGTLSKVISSHDAVQESFADGLRAARQGTFTHTAFCCRAMVVTDMMPAAHAASYLSGLLIGTELFEIVKKAGDAMSAPVQVVGSPALTSRYLSALELLGIPARAWQPDGVYLAALRALFNIPR
jgi:2-dehydro-3-deoxygalactonokinase